MDATLLHPPTHDQLRRQGNLQLQTPCENEPLANGAALVAAPIKKLGAESGEVLVCN